MQSEVLTTKSRKMNAGDRKEVKEIVMEQTAGPMARIEASIFVIEATLKTMNEHMSQANHRTSKNEERIEELEDRPEHSVANCPQDGTLRDLKQYIETQKAVRGSWYKSVALIATIVGIIYSLTLLSYKVIEKRQESYNKKMEQVEQMIRDQAVRNE